MKIKTLLFAAIAGLALVCTSCGKDEGKIVVEVEYGITFTGDAVDQATGQQFINECKAAFAPYSGTEVTDSKVISVLNPIVDKYNNCNKLSGTATLLKSVSGATPSIVKTWELSF